MMMMVPAESPINGYDFDSSLAPSPTPSPTPSPSQSPSFTSSSIITSVQQAPPPPSRLPVQFSPPLIVMVVIVATAFLIVTYSRLISRHVIPPILRVLRRYKRWRRRRRGARSYLPSSSGDLDSLPFDSPFFETSDGFHVCSPYGLDESVIKTIPLALYYTTKPNRERRDCAVCLLEFEDDDYVRTLPVCSHAFHVDCIDIWLRSHANCPLCRAGVFRPESPFVPVMAARIRPSLDDSIFRSFGERLESEAFPDSRRGSISEITPCVEEQSPMRNHNNNNHNNYSEERFNGRDFMLKRSYSFGFERNLASERMVMEPATTSPWRYRRGNFWSKRPSPFGSITKPRVFSFRYYRGMKSPFFRRRGFFPLSERFAGSSNGAGGGSSRRTKSMTSPMFMRSSAAVAGAAAFSSSRLRCGDPEALLSPDRFNRR